MAAAKPDGKPPWGGGSKRPHWEGCPVKHVFIINPAAGKRNRTSEVLQMAEKLRQKHGLDCQCMLTRSPGHATELARQLAAGGQPLRLYACGGDGTNNEVANGIVGMPNAAMTCIPIGTGNDFLKNFGSAQPLFSDAENLWDSPAFPMDVIECNGRYALTIACSGIDARIADDVHKYSGNPLLDGKGSYIASLIVNFLFKGIGSHWTLTADGQSVTGDYALVAACNGRYYGGGFMPVAEARMDDGVLNTLIVRNVSRSTFLKFVGPYSKGGYRTFPHLAKCLTAKEIRIQSEQEDIVTCLDGEIIRSRDVRICLAKEKLLFFGPAGCDCNATAVGPQPAAAVFSR